MELVIGGRAQGKLDYVLRDKDGGKIFVFEGAIPEMEELAYINSAGGTAVINNFQLWVKNELLNGGDPEKKMIELISLADRCVIISDEVGNGVVPVDPFEREYRERCGRILVETASRADKVVRVICGIAMRIK